MNCTATDLDFIRALVFDESAIVLDDSKAYLIEARLGPVARAAGLESVSAIVQRLRRHDTELKARVVEAMTTNETSFFRDAHPFDVLATDVLPELARARATARKLRIWSAASSTGQEAYTLAMVVRERAELFAGWDVRILGTDIAEGVLAQAREGRYAQLQVNRGLPAAMLSRYFERDGIAWRVKADVRALTEFRRLNLVGAWPVLGPFDVVFLRNVLIYFDAATKQQVLDRVLRVLAPDGCLFVGGAEMIAGVHDGFVAERHGRTSWYRPAVGALGRAS